LRGDAFWSELQRCIGIFPSSWCLDIHCYLEAMELGAVDYLERPEPDDLGWVVETQLRRRDTD
jgi:FixJ family two-component response regulator